MMTTLKTVKRLNNAGKKAQDDDVRSIIANLLAFKDDYTMGANAPSTFLD